jgi:hypothetical protein
VRKCCEQAAGQARIHLFDEKVKNRIMEEGLLTLGLRETGVYAGAKLTKLENELRKEADKEGVKISDSLNGIAKWIGVAPKVLKTTIDEYNASCDRGHSVLPLIPDVLQVKTLLNMQRGNDSIGGGQGVKR